VYEQSLTDFLRGKIAELERTIEARRRYLELLDRSAPAGTAAAEPAPAPAQAPPQVPAVLVLGEQNRPQPEQPLQEIKLQTKAGRELGAVRVFPDRVEIEPSFTIRKNTPPFQKFLIEKIFWGMKSKDEEARDAGKLDPGQVLDWELVERDGGVLRRIILRGLNDPSVRERRLREIASATRWTFEKMLERTKSAF
jgi:hypothetical protein